MRVAKLIPLHRLLYECSADEASIVSKLKGEIYSIMEHIKELRAKRVFVCSNDRYFFLSAILAAFQVGAEVVLPHTNATEFLRAHINDQDILLTEKVTLSDRIFQEDAQFKIVDPASTFVSLYTSGSTGEAKKVVKTLLQIEAEIACLNSIWGHVNGAFLSMVSHHYIYGLLFSLLWPVCMKKSFSRFTFSAWEEVLNVAKDGDVIVSTPAYLGRFTFVENGKNSSRAGEIFSSGAPLSFDAAQHIKEYFSILPVEIYGSTETGGIAYRTQTAKDSRWVPFPNVEVGKKSDGCLQIKSDYLMDGFFHPTQDRVNLHNDNTFDLLGRADRIVKIEGKRVCLTEIEKRLNEHLWINNNITLVLDSSNRDEIGAVVILSEKGMEQFATLGRYMFIRCLKEFLSQCFDLVLIPRKWRFVDGLPLDNRGKCAQLSLRDLFSDTCDPVEEVFGD